VVDLLPLWTAIAGGLMSAGPTAWVGYRQGKADAETEHDRDVDRRLRDVETEVTDIRATVRERKQR
jgi:hypothetical protein